MELTFVGGSTEKQPYIRWIRFKFRHLAIKLSIVKKKNQFGAFIGGIFIDI